jgi:hypothetical protein
MARYPDGYFDLAIVDPPYGGGNHETHNARNPLPMRFGGRFDKYRIAETSKKKTIHATGGHFAKYDSGGGGGLPDGRNMGVKIRGGY